MQFRARLAAVRGTPSRADDVRTVVRLNLECHDLPGDDWIFLATNIGEELAIHLEHAPPAPTPLEEAIDAATEQEVVVPSAGRRRNGTRSSERV